MRVIEAPAAEGVVHRELEIGAVTPGVAIIQDDGFAGGFDMPLSFGPRPKEPARVGLRPGRGAERTDRQPDKPGRRKKLLMCW